MTRPFPPIHLQEEGARFEPAFEVAVFIQQAFIQPLAPFGREEYLHLKEARIAVLWTNVPRVKDGLSTLGMAQLYRDSGDKWTAGRTAQQVFDWFAEWFEDEPFPHFIITLFAPAAVQMNDSTFCALLAHELRHCGQKRDLWGEPKYDLNGDPEFAMQGHDVEQFVSVVEDFGIEAAGQKAVEFVAAAQKAPRFKASEVSGICGCGARIMAVA